MTKPRTYEFRGGNAQAIESREPQVLLCGVAGSGKSLASLMKLFIIADRVPNTRLLIFRKYRRSLTDTALVTFENDILPPNHPAMDGASRYSRHSYKFPNGSEIVCGGCDAPDKWKSSQFDIAYGQEATELESNDIDMIVRGLRNGKLPYSQLLMDCNPSHPRHWLKLRCDEGKTRLVTSVHKDNPAYFSNGQWTELGKQYLQTLEGLTGHNKARLLYGQWAAAEGLVYSGWKAENVCEIPLGTGWEYFLSIDFGYNDFCVCQWWARFPEKGLMYLIRELVVCETTVEIFAKQVKSLNREVISAVICDHDREDRATFEQYSGWSTIPAVKDIEFGVHRMQERINQDKIGVKPDALCWRDTHDRARGKPQGFLEEIISYCWDEKRDGVLKELPKDKDNHSMDAARYAVVHDYLLAASGGPLVRAA